MHLNALKHLNIAVVKYVLYSLMSNRTLKFLHFMVQVSDLGLPVYSFIHVFTYCTSPKKLEN